MIASPGTLTPAMEALLPFADRMRTDVPLAPLTTIGVGGSAQWVFEPRDVDDLAAFLRTAKAEGIATVVLGAGANLLVSDGGVGGVVIRPVHLVGVEISGERVRTEAGVGLTELIARTTDLGLGGLEALAGIPAQIGGAVAMNAGGRYAWVSHLLETAELVTADGAKVELSNAELRFGYRKAALPPGSVVTAATFRLKTGERGPLKREAGRILKEKNAAQPTTGRNFGCTFANPEGASAGKLVEAAGLKGLRMGDARISPLHGNFIENLGAATAADVLALVVRMEQEVKSRFGIELEREVRVWA